MTSVIVHSQEPIALFGGGDADRDAVISAMALSSKVVAADSGANLALQYNITPNAVIGDFDSISDQTLAVLPKEVLHKIDAQDSTDFDKALRNISAPLILAVGFTGARIDHQLAVMNTLVARADKRCVLLGKEEVVFVCPPRLELELPLGSVFSLFPMGSVEGRSKGLKWPIDGLKFAPDTRVGTSNEVSGPVEIEVSGPNMLVILPREMLGEVVSSLAKVDAHWPSRAG